MLGGRTADHYRLKRLMRNMTSVNTTRSRMEVPNGNLLTSQRRPRAVLIRLSAPNHECPSNSANEVRPKVRRGYLVHVAESPENENRFTNSQVRKTS